MLIAKKDTSRSAIEENHTIYFVNEEKKRTSANMSEKEAIKLLAFLDGIGVEIDVRF